MGRSQNPRITKFSEFLLKRRRELGISLLELERRTGLHNARLSRWERGIEMPDRVERFSPLAAGLEVPLADLYAVAGVELPTELPTLRPYLRSKYGDLLPRQALAEIARYSEYVASRYGVTTGPIGLEDEDPPESGPGPNTTDDERLL